MYNFYHKNFEDLTVHELYDCIELREEIFVVEQQCIYRDADGKDKKAIHLLCTDGSTLIAYCRILPPHVSYKEAAIGRVVVKKEYRGKLLGKELMNHAKTLTRHLYPNTDIRISAQEYLLNFYTSLGFIPVSEMYLEDGIPHIEMLLQYITNA